MGKLKNQIELKYLDLKDIKPYSKNPRQITDKAIEVVKNSIKKFGIKVPLVIDRNNEIVCGHTRYKALVLLQLEDEGMMDFSKIPCVLADDLSPSEIKAFRIADNKTSEFSIWDEDLLNVEVDGIKDIDLREFGIDYEIKNELDDVKIEEENTKVRSSKKLKCPNCDFEFEV